MGVVDATHDLQGEWRLERRGGLLPPLGAMRKRIDRDRGSTIVGPVGLPFEVVGLELRYRLPLLALVDVLVRESADVYNGTTTFFDRHIGTFRMTRTV
jgi:hypothetical protein